MKTLERLQASIKRERRPIVDHLEAKLRAPAESSFGYWDRALARAIRERDSLMKASLTLCEFLRKFDTGGGIMWAIEAVEAAIKETEEGGIKNLDTES